MHSKLSCILLLMVLSCSVISKAENKLLLCTEYDKTGKYSGDYNTWKIEKTGNYMYIYYASDKPISDTLYVNLDKTFNRKDTNYYLFDQYYLLPDVSKKFAVNKYTFSKPGNYRISVFDRNTEKLLKTHTTSISYNDEQYNDVFFTDTWYYSESSIFFCDSISDNIPIGRKQVFNYQPGRAFISLYVEQLNKKAFKTDHFFIKVYNKETQQLVLSDSYNLNGNWFWTYINVFLKEKGKYRLELYNADDIFINMTDLEIR